MYSFKMSKVIGYIIALFHSLGLWQRDVMPNDRITKFKLFYFANYTLYLMSLIVGAIINDKIDDRIFLVDMALVALGCIFKLWLIIWRKNQVADILDRICNFSVQDYDNFKLVNDKLTKFINFVIVLLVFLNIGGGFATLVFPFFGSEKKLFYNIALPFDSGSNKIAFFIASAFIFTGVNLTIIAFSLSVLIWYSMIICALRYEVLGNEIKNMVTSKCAEELESKRKMTDMENQSTFRKDLINAIESYQNIRK